MGFLIILFYSTTSYAQDTLKPLWIKHEPSGLINGNSEAWAIGGNSSGNLFWGVNMDMPGLFQYNDATIYKLNNQGIVEWIDTAAADAYAQQSYFLKATDSTVFAAGRTCSQLGTGSCDVLVFTTDPITGETGWTFTWDQGFGYEEIDGLVPESDGIYLTGWSAGDSSAVDVLLMKIDYAGNVLWQTTWTSPGSRDDHQDGHVVVDDSVIYVSGLYNGSPLLGWDGSALLAKFSKTDGSLIDSVLYGRDDIWLNAENALGMTSDGEFLYITGYSTTSANNWDIFVTKYDKNLNQIWYTTWGGTAAAESARSIVVHPDGSIYVGGNTESFGNGEMDVALVKLDSNGTVQWYKTWGGTSDDQTFDLYLNGDDLYLTGKAQSFHPNNKWQAFLMRVGLAVNSSVDELSNANHTRMHISPNPMSDVATIHFQGSQLRAKTVQIFDMQGRLIKSYPAVNSNMLQIQKSDLGSGMFFVQMMELDGGITPLIQKLVVK